MRRKKKTDLASRARDKIPLSLYHPPDGAVVQGWVFGCLREVRSGLCRAFRSAISAHRKPDSARTLNRKLVR